jgi:hypothetical protein
MRNATRCSHWWLAAMPLVGGHVAWAGLPELPKLPGGVVCIPSCTLPAGMAVRRPVGTCIDDASCPPIFGFKPLPSQSLEDFLRADAMSITDSTTGVFSDTAAESLAALGEARLAHSPQLAVSDGLLVFLEPFSPGTHTLQVGSTNPFLGTTTGTFTLTVGDEPLPGHGANHPSPTNPER